MQNLACAPFVDLNGTLLEAQIRPCDTWMYVYISFNMCPIYTHDGTNAKFSTNWDETDYSVYNVSDHKPFCRVSWTWLLWRVSRRRWRTGGSWCSLLSSWQVQTVTLFHNSVTEVLIFKSSRVKVNNTTGLLQWCTQAIVQFESPKALEKPAHYPSLANDIQSFQSSTYTAKNRAPEETKATQRGGGWGVAELKGTVAWAGFLS